MIDKVFMKQYDIIFIIETHANGQTLPNINGYQVIFDPTFPLTSHHGGIAAYISIKYFHYVTSIRFTKCTLSFSFTILPQYSFVAVYIYPVDSINYLNTDFGILSEELAFWIKNGNTPYVGGDFNSRLGDIAEISSKTLKWRYEANIDTGKNHHGKELAGICEIHKILPLNHCQYLKYKWPGKFTYNKGGKHSQIDFCLTTKGGRKNVKDFQIIDSQWHVSDHLPISLTLSLPYEINVESILVRAADLSSEYNMSYALKTYKFNFNYESACNELRQRQHMIEDSLRTGSPDTIINTIEEVMIPILKTHKVKKEVTTNNSDFDILAAMKECDELYLKYIQLLHNKDQVEESLQEYQNARNKLNDSIIKQQENNYKMITDSGDSKKLWAEINWSGKYREKLQNNIPIQLMANYFEKLYEPLDINEKAEMDNLETYTYIPVTDDPITGNEMKTAYKKMKKGGYDFSLPVMSMLAQILSPTMTLLMNLIFYVAFPLKLAISLLCAIPKKGNLKLLTNYRGIQMQPLITNLYDRIIANRLMLWAKVNTEQTAFQKGKSTLDHIFLIRTIICLTKQANVSLFIGFFDLAKAFDKVSRPLLLKSLIRLDIGTSIFYAIKSMYSVTRCVLKSGQKLSDIFTTHSGIKQGAPSSVILFIIFMDQFIDDLQKKCIKENILGDLHILLHVDDTIIVSTRQGPFTEKCNTLIGLFHEKRLALNLKKSGFLVINPKHMNDRNDIKLKSGWLTYTENFIYLGSVFSDKGNTHHDINLHATIKSKSVYVKLANFIRNNNYAPIDVKRKVLQSCLQASLLYGCEAWSSCSLQKIETLYRKAIKIVFGMNIRTPNEIVYIESGLIYLKAEIYKRQFKFWSKILDNLNSPSSLATVYHQAIEKNTHFIRHYKNLHKQFSDEESCYNFYKNKFSMRMAENIKMKAQLVQYGIANDYIKINPKLTTPDYHKKHTIIENNRLIVTKYRTGSHYLRINTGRWDKTPKERRLCKCNLIQIM